MTHPYRVNSPPPEERGPRWGATWLARYHVLAARRSRFGEPFQRWILRVDLPTDGSAWVLRLIQMAAQNKRMQERLDRSMRNMVARYFEGHRDG